MVLQGLDLRAPYQRRRERPDVVPPLRRGPNWLVGREPPLRTDVCGADGATGMDRGAAGPVAIDTKQATEPRPRTARSAERYAICSAGSGRLRLAQD